MSSIGVNDVPRPTTGRGVSAVVTLGIGVLAGLGGCAGRPVTILTEPPGAAVSGVAFRGDELTGRPVRFAGGTTAPATANLPRGEGFRYVFTAAAPQYRTTSIDVPSVVAQGTLRIELPRELLDTAGWVYEPAYDGRVWALVPRREPSVAYVFREHQNGVIDPRSVESAFEIAAVTANRSPDVDYPALAASPTSDAIVYQRVERRPLPSAEVSIPTRGAGPRSAATLRSIAEEYGVSVEALRATNPDLPPRVGDDDARLGGRVLRVDRHEVVSEIYRQTPGGAATRLTSERADELTPSFDGYGEEIVFASNANSPNSTLWRRRAEGGGRLVRVTRGDALDYAPSVGRDVATYTSLPPRPPGRDTEALPQVWTTRLDRDEQAKIADGEQGRMSPDDRQVVYVQRPLSRAGATASTLAGRQLFVIDADGGPPQRLWASAAYDVKDPSWSPDGQFVVFAARDVQQAEGSNWDLYVIPADASAAPRQVTSNLSHDSAPTFDRFGRRLYFRSDRGGAWNVWALEVDLEGLFTATD